SGRWVWLLLAPRPARSAACGAPASSRLNVIQVCAIAGAGRIIAIDTSEAKPDLSHEAEVAPSRRTAAPRQLPGAPLARTGPRRWGRTREPDRPFVVVDLRRGERGASVRSPASSGNTVLALGAARRGTCCMRLRRAAADLAEMHRATEDVMLVICGGLHLAS